MTTVGALPAPGTWMLNTRAGVPPAGTSTFVVRAPAPTIASDCVIASSPLRQVVCRRPGRRSCRAGFGVVASAFSYSMSCRSEQPPEAGFAHVPVRSLSVPTV